MDTITFHFLISLAVSKGLDMLLMDVISTSLYGSIDNDICIKIPEGFKFPKANNTKARSICSITMISIWIEVIRTHVVQSPT